MIIISQTISITKILFGFKKSEFVSLGISNLLLQNKTVRASAPKILQSSEKMGGNQWDALRASHLLARQKSLSFVLVSLLYQVRTYFQSRN